MKMKENRSTRGKTGNANAVSYTVTMKPVRKEHPEEMAEESLTRLIESYRCAPYPSETTILNIDEVVYERACAGNRTRGCHDRQLCQPGDIRAPGKTCRLDPEDRGTGSETTITTVWSTHSFFCSCMLPT